MMAASKKEKPLRLTPDGMADAQRLLDRAAEEGLLLLRPPDEIRREALRRAEAKLRAALDTGDYSKIEKALTIDVQAIVDRELVQLAMKEGVSARQRSARLGGHKKKLRPGTPELTEANYLAFAKQQGFSPATAKSYGETKFDVEAAEHFGYSERSMADRRAEWIHRRPSKPVKPRKKK